MLQIDHTDLDSVAGGIGQISLGLMAIALIETGAAIGFAATGIGAGAGAVLMGAAALDMAAAIGFDAAGM